MDSNMRTAWSIIFSEFEGGEFDFNLWKFKEKK